MKRARPGWLSPSMRRPVDVNAHFDFLLPSNQFLLSQAAPVAILPSALFVSDIRSVQGGCSRFSRCCYLVSVLSSHLFGGSWAPGLSRSHLDSAAELGCSDQNFLGHGAHRFLAIAQWFVYLAAHPQPMEQYRQLSRHGHYRSLLGIFSFHFWCVRHDHLVSQLC